MIEPALKQYVENNVDVYAPRRSSPELADIADLFENCSSEGIRCFIKARVNLLWPPGPIHGPWRSSSKQCRDAAAMRPRWNTGPDPAAVGAAFKAGGDDDFDAARKATSAAASESASFRERGRGSTAPPSSAALGELLRGYELRKGAVMFREGGAFVAGRGRC